MRVINRRPDIVVFVNGLPLGVIELKNAAEEDATTFDAFKDRQLYKEQIPSLFHTNAIVVASDGTDARIGTISSDWERMMPWRTIEGEALAPATRRSWCSRMYVDKPMKGHGLMQAIARVNRVFSNKPGGLVVDYLGLAHELKQALAVYTESGGQGETAIDQEEAVVALLSRVSICKTFFHRFDWSKRSTGSPAQKLSLLPAGQEHILAAAGKDAKPEEYRQRFLQTVTELSKAFAFAVPHEQALAIRDDVGFFQAVRAAMTKGGGEKKKTEAERDAAIRQIVSRAVASDEVIDIFASAGLKKPDISILSEQFLAEVRGMPQKNLAVELLRKLLAGEIKLRSRKFLVQSKSFAGMLEQAIRRYQNRAIEAAAVIEELIKIAKDMREADELGHDSGLSEEERAFYDALADNESAVQAMGSKELRVIATELVTSVRRSVTIDWTLRESARARIMVMVKRILRKHGYPPDLQDEATKTVLALMPFGVL